MSRIRNKRSLVGILLSILMVLSLASVIAVKGQDNASDMQMLGDPVTGYNSIYEHVSPSVVAIGVSGNRTDQFNQTQPFAGQGSGFVIDKAGHIVTNYHVVEGADNIAVEFFSGILTKGKVIGTDPDSDLAVIQVDLPAEDLFPIDWGDSDTLLIGQPTLAIGSPYGQRWTLTSGIVSALDRSIPGTTQFSIGGVIQTDTAINPGNSGGPLLDLQGRVIGVNSQIRSDSGSNSGVGFAIPSNLTHRVAQELIDNGFVSYSYLGISGSDVNLSVIEGLSLPNNTRGVVVGRVEPGGPADRANLLSAGEVTTVNGVDIPQTLDIITSINGHDLKGIADLISYLAKDTKPGDTATLTILRDGTDTLNLDVRLTPRP